jgi:hypothetical protein
VVADQRCSRDQIFPMGDHESAVRRQRTRTLGEIASGVFTVLVLVTLSHPNWAAMGFIGLSMRFAVDVMQTFKQFAQ